MTPQEKSIGVFIDGGYYAKINEALNENLNLNIHLSSLFDFISEYLADKNGLRKEDCYITESHYFRGRYRVGDASDKHLLFSERKFEDSLIENDVIFHYKHLREVEKDGKPFASGFPSVSVFSSCTNYSAGAHLQRTGETIAPSSFNCFMALSTSLRSSPLSSAILPAFNGSPASFIVANTFSFASIVFIFNNDCF